MSHIMLSPSLMCADLINLSPVLRQLEEAQVDFLHIDVMDGVFVPNYAFGTDFIRRLMDATTIPLDVHLMIEHPENKLAMFPLRPGDCLSIHAEASIHLQRALAAIRERGVKAGVAINPATPLCVLDEVMDDIDLVLLMTVNPGFAGQKMVPASLDKICRLRRRLDDTGRQDIWIEVDGNVSFENGVRMAQAGANLLVGGSSSVFAAGATVLQNIERVRKMLCQEG